MKSKTREIVSKLIRNRFDSLIMSWEIQEREELIKAAADINPTLANEMKSDNKF